MNKAIMIFPWIVTLLVVGYVIAIGVDFHNQDIEWQQKCKEANGYPTQTKVMDFHSNVTRLCIKPEAVVDMGE